MKLTLSFEELKTLVEANSTIQAFVENPVVNNQNHKKVKFAAEVLDTIVDNFVKELDP